MLAPAPANPPFSVQFYGKHCTGASRAAILILLDARPTKDKKICYQRCFNIEMTSTVSNKSTIFESYSQLSVTDEVRTPSASVSTSQSRDISSYHLRKSFSRLLTPHPSLELITLVPPHLQTHHRENPSQLALQRHGHRIAYLGGHNELINSIFSLANCQSIRIAAYRKSLKLAGVSTPTGNKVAYVGSTGVKPLQTLRYVLLYQSVLRVRYSVLDVRLDAGEPGCARIALHYVGKIELTLSGMKVAFSALAGPISTYKPR